MQMNSSMMLLYKCLTSTKKRCCEKNAEYRAKENLFSKTFIWQSVNCVSPTTWWTYTVYNFQIDRLLFAAHA